MAEVYEVPEELVAKSIRDEIIQSFHGRLAHHLDYDNSSVIYLH